MAGTRQEDQQHGEVNSEWFSQSVRDSTERIRLTDRLRRAVKVIPKVSPVVGRLPRRRPRQRQAERAPGHGSEHRVDSIDVWSVARTALVFYAAVLAVVAVGIAVAWLVANQLGVVSNFEQFMRRMGFKDFQILSGKFLLAASLIAAALVTTWVMLTVVATALYNVIAIPWGGVRVTLTPVSDAATPTGFAESNGNGAGSTNGSGTTNDRLPTNVPTNGNGGAPTNGNGGVHTNGNGGVHSGAAV